MLEFINMKRLTSNMLPIASIILAVFVYLMNMKLIHIYVSLPFLAGADGAGHWSIAEYYSTHIFPKTWGWVPVWFGGMPFPQFYPPFFYFFNALVAHLLPWFEFLSITKVIVLTGMLAAPGATIWMAFNFFHKKDMSRDESFRVLAASLLTGILSALMICNVGNQSSPGFTLEASINKGFAPQSFALIPILICLGFTAQIKNSKTARYGAGFFFAISLLSNVHAALLLVIVISCIGLIDFINVLRYKNRAKKELLSIIWLYTKVFGISGLACSFWFVPLVSTYDYFSTVPLSFDWKNVIMPMRFIAGISFPLAIYFAYKERNSAITGTVVGMSLILTLAAFGADQHFPTLPLHIYRWLALLPYVAMLMVGYVFKNIIVYTKQTIVVGLGIVAIVAGSYWHQINAKSDNGIFFNYKKTNIDSLVEFLASRPGLTAVGTEFEYWRSASFIIDGKLGLAGVPTITHIIRESASNGLFLTPVRNTFSEREEMAGIRSYIGRNKDFLTQPMTAKLDRARALGIRYLIISDPVYNKTLATSTQVTRIGKFGPRVIYQINGYAPKVSILDTLPTLAITPLNFKVRSGNEYNFTTFNEQLFMSMEYPNVVIARSPDEKIDEISDKSLSNFGSLILTKYPYTDVNAAFSKIKKFAETKPVFAIQSRDPLFTKIHNESLINKNVHTYLDPTEKQKRKVSVNNDIKSMIKIIKKNTISSVQARITPYYIRQTYYPWWVRIDKEQVYAASPMYTLTFKDPVDQLYFETPVAVTRGYSISILMLLLIAVSEIFSAIQRNKNSKN